MAQPQPTEDHALENQLRGMILGNSRAGPEGQNGQRGRGRGRGGHSRGDYTGRSEPGHQQVDNTSSSHSPYMGRGRGDSKYRGTRGHHAGQQASPVLMASAATVNLPNPKQPYNGQAHSLQHSPRAQPKSIMQRAGKGSPHVAQQPNPTQYRDFLAAQVEYLTQVAAVEIPKVQMSQAELEEKEAFRLRLEGVLRQAMAAAHSRDIKSISLVGFGSLSSGFGMPGSDMDLAVVLNWNDTAKADQTADCDIPRILERAVLDAKMGGRLLTRTRVPILKVCEAPTEALYTALFDERKKWDELPEDEKCPIETPVLSPAPKKSTEREDHQPKAREATPTGTTQSMVSGDANSTTKDQQARTERPWLREKALGPLDFPKTGCGIQCDLNFGNLLGIHNTHMLRCYSLTDPRVRPVVLFVKSWAKRRKINSSYSGTLSSYGWVLMVLHYLVNIAQPPVCPNLQRFIPPSSSGIPPRALHVSGYQVLFWRDEREIQAAVQSSLITHNTQSVAALLRGFFQYFASISGHGPSRPQQFFWTTEVLSLRSTGGILSKQSKGWTQATTTITKDRKITNRYLLAIEDPFEIDHNVARTVTHRGLVTIRDEFRRTWRILGAVGRRVGSDEGGLFDEVSEEG